MDVYAAIQRQHNAVRSTLQQLREAVNRADTARSPLFDVFNRHLWAHHKVEEAVFYAALRAHQDVRDQALAACAKHHRINLLLEELESTPTTSDEWAAKLAVFAQLLEQHMNEEENQVFATARSVLSAEQAADLGKKLESRHRVVVTALVPVTER